MAVSSTEQHKRKLAAERRTFMMTTGGAAVGLGLLAEASQAFGHGRGGITQGDAAILRFLAAAEIIETGWPGGTPPGSLDPGSSR